MQDVIVYSKDNCAQCRTAMALLKTKGVEFEVKKLGVDITREELIALIPHARDMPQITVDGTPLIGMDGLRSYLSKITTVKGETGFVQHFDPS